MIKKQLGIVGKCLLLYFLLVNLITAFLELAASSEGANVYLTTGAGTLLATALVYWYWKKKTSLELDVKKQSGLTLPQSLKYLALLFGINLLCALLILLLESMLSYTLPTAEFELGTTIKDKLSLLLYTVILAPVCEELLFRGICLQTLKRGGVWFAMVSSSLLFALTHANLPQMIPAFFVGMIFCAIVIKSGSLLQVMFLHAVNNCFALLPSAVPSLAFLLGLFYIGCIIYSICVLLRLWKNRKQALAEVRKENDLPFAALFRNWPIALYCMLMCVLTLLFFFIL